jgi:hypothetical protein
MLGYPKGRRPFGQGRGQYPAREVHLFRRNGKWHGRILRHPNDKRQSAFSALIRGPYLARLWNDSSAAFSVAAISASP